MGAVLGVSASRLTMIERFFGDLTTERLRSGVLTSVPLVSDIRANVR